MTMQDHQQKKKLVAAMQRYQELDITLVELNQRVSMAEMDAKAKAMQEEMYINEIRELNVELNKVKTEVKEKATLI